MRVGVVMAAALAATACQREPRPVVTIDSAPLVVVLEGEVAERPIAVSPLPREPLDADDFTVVADGDGDGSFNRDGDGRFAELTIAGSPGALVLRVVPHCGAAAPATDVVAEVRVEARTAAVAPAPLAVQIVDQRGPACAPVVNAWIAAADDCEAAALPTAPPVRIVAGNRLLCVQVTEPGGEPIWVRASTDAPAGLIPALGLALALDLDETGSFVAPIRLGAGGTPHDIVGRFELAVDVRRAPPPASADTAARIALDVGVPGTTIEITARPAVPLAEFATGTIGATVWSWPGPDAPDDGLEPCLRAVRATTQVAPPVERRVPFLTVTAVDSGVVVDSGAVETGTASPWLYGRRFRIGVAPPIDAAALEEVRLEAGRCASGPPDSAPLGMVHSRLVELATTNIADELACSVPPSGPQRLAAVACADLDGDGSREILVQADPGLCLFGGDRPARVDVALGTVDALHTLSIRTTGGPPTPHVIAELDPGGPHELAKDQATGDWGWVSYRSPPPHRQQPNIPTLLLPFADELAGGATHAIVRAGESADLRAVCLVNDCTEVVIPDVLGPGERLAGLGAADLDDDDDPTLDLAVATARPDGDGFRLRLRLYDVSWVGLSPTFTEAVPAASLTGRWIPHAEVVFAAARPACAAPACIDAVPDTDTLVVAVPRSTVVFVVTGGAQLGDALLEPEPVATSIHQLIELDGQVVGTFDLGLRRRTVLTPPEEGVAWTLVDPYGAENGDFNVIPPVDPFFGAALAACHGGGAAVFITRIDPGDPTDPNDPGVGRARVTQVAGAGP